MKAYGTGSSKKRTAKRKDGSIRTYYEAYVYGAEGKKFYGHGKSEKEAFANARFAASAVPDIECEPEFASERERVRTVYEFALECLDLDSIREQSIKRYKEVAQFLLDPTYDVNTSLNWLPERARLLGNVRLDEVAYEDVEVFLAKFRKDYSASSEGVMRTLLSRTFKRALRRGWMSRNHVSDLDQVQRVYREREALSDEYMTSMIAEAKSTSMRAALALLTLGLRIDEVLGATWDEVDGDILHVRHQQIRVAKKDQGLSKVKSELGLGPTKRFSSTRKVKLHQFHLTCIQAAKDSAIPVRVRTQAKESEDKLFVCPNQTGGMWSYNAFRTAYHKLRKKLNLHPSTPHDWRATAATNSIEAGFDPKAVAKTLGHSRVEQTLGIYTRTRKSTTDAISDRIGSKLEEGLAQRAASARMSDSPEETNLADMLLDDVE